MLPHTTEESASEILNRRLASGALTLDQYELLREALSDAAAPSFGAQPGRPAGTRV